MHITTLAASNAPKVDSYEPESLGRLLLIHPDRSTCASITRVLERNGFKLSAFTDGRSGLDALQQSKFDLALVAMELGDVSGSDVLEYITTTSDGSIPVVLLVSQRSDRAMMARALERGASAYIAIPLEDEELLRVTIANALKAARAEHEKQRLLGEIRHYSQRLQTIVESMPGIIWESAGGYDVEEHRLTYASGYFKEVLGYTMEEWNEKRSVWQDLIHPEDIELSRSTMTNVLAGRKPASVEYRVFAKDGRIVPLQVYLSGIYDSEGRPLGMRGVAMDVSERRRQEEALRRAKDQAEAASRSKDQFIAVLSHELRTPLTPVLSTIEMLEADENISPSTRSLVEMLRRNVELEARLIDDLLDLTRISKGKLTLNLKPVNVHNIIGNVLGISDRNIKQKNLDVRLSLFANRFYVQADPARLQQILWNLLHNAVKFTPEAGTISIRTRTKRQGPAEGGPLIIEITDTGIGIEPEVLPHIFDAFEQGEVLITRQFGGLGLGLAIARNLVIQHGGTITAKSRGKNLGATFTIELPVIDVADTAGTAAPVVRAIAAPVAKKKILLVDDHADTGNVLQLLLERRGFEVQRAANVSAALSLAERYEFDLLVSDIGLPDGNGYELLERIRERKGEVLAIALSGFGANDDISKSLKAGFRAHITKPFNFPDLHRKIGELLSVAG